MDDFHRDPGIGMDRVNCISIPVTDLGRSLRFYQALTGIVATPERLIARVRPPGNGGLGRREHRVSTIHLSNINLELSQQDQEFAPTRNDQRRTSDVHLSFEVDDLDAVLARLIETGLICDVEIYQADHDQPDPSRTTIAYFEDPDGTRLALTQPAGSFRRFNERFVP